MRNILVAIAFLCAFLSAQGQDDPIDSLKSELKRVIPDSTRVSTLIALSSNYYQINPEESKRLALEARDIAKRIGFKSGLAYAHKSLGLNYYFQNNWIDALLEWKLSLEVFESINDLNGMSNILNNLGSVHFNGGDDESALEYYLQALKLAEGTNDSLRIVSALINIGTVYLNKSSSRDLALSYYKRAFPISKGVQDYGAIGTCSVNMGEIYLQKPNKLDSALYYFETALDAYQKSATGNVAFALKGIGSVYAKRGDFERAIQYQTEAFEWALEMGWRLEMAQSLLGLASSYENLKDFPKAIETFNQAKDLSTDIGALYEMQSAYEGLANSYSDISDFEQAYQNKNMYSILKDTLYNAEMDKKLQSQTLIYEIEKKQGQISLLEKDQELREVELKRQKAIRNGVGVFGIMLLIFVGGLFSRYRYVRKTNKIIEIEKERSESLLLNILPSATAEELKTKGSATPKHYEKVSVLFTDFKGFTQIAEKLTPQELVAELNECFIAFDMIMDKYGLEKIKTIGDAYMCAGGIPTIMDDNPFGVVMAALEIRDFMNQLKIDKEAQGKECWELRIGIHTGPVIAGVVGKNKFAYDIWGDAVNTASRMESSGIPGKVNISEFTYEHIKDRFVCTHRGKIKAKNKGEIDMYIVEGLVEKID